MMCNPSACLGRQIRVFSKDGSRGVARILKHGRVRIDIGKLEVQFPALPKTEQFPGSSQFQVLPGDLKPVI